MKHITVLIGLLLTAIPLFAQNISYRYDAAGNRTERAITLRSGSSSAAEAPPTVSVDDIVAEHELKIYPNPTKGILKVEISNYSEDLQTDFQLLDLSGRLINRRKAESEAVSFDLSGHPAGIYLLVIHINGEQITWKIIKE